jgi:hypothetical protein
MPSRANSRWRRRESSQCEFPPSTTTRTRDGASKLVPGGVPPQRGEAGPGRWPFVSGCGPRARGEPRDPAQLGRATAEGAPRGVARGQRGRTGRAGDGASSCREAGVEEGDLAQADQHRVRASDVTVAGAHDHIAFPGTARSFTSAGNSRIETASRIWPHACPATLAAFDRRIVRRLRRCAIRSLRSTRWGWAPSELAPGHRDFGSSSGCSSGPTAWLATSNGEGRPRTWASVRYRSTRCG